MQMTAIQTQPVLEAEGFDLRPVRASDQTVAASRILGHPKGARAPDQPSPDSPFSLTRDTVKAVLATALSPARDAEVWVIDASKSAGPEVAGLIVLTRLCRDQSEIGFWVAPEFWNGELAFDVVHMLTTANPLNTSALFATVFQDNPACAGVLTRAGFVYLGDAETYCLARDAAVPTWTYAAKRRD